MEARETLHADLLASLTIINKEYLALKKIFSLTPGPDSLIDNGLVEYYGPKKPKMMIIALGSVTGTIRAVLKKQPTVGVLKIKVYRPFPAAAINKIIKSVKLVAVLEKAVSPGQAGPLYTEIAAASQAANWPGQIKNYIVGLGGRDVTEKMVADIIKDLPRHNANLKFIGHL
jgi:pyruvate ferredoxin oxidoreductase alpha subunit